MQTMDTVMNKNIFILVLLCCMSSCSTNDNFFVGQFIHKTPLQTVSIDDLRVSKSILECIGAMEITVIDTMLLINTANAKDQLLHLYNVNDYSYISSVINQGKGPQEDFIVYWSGQSYSDTTARIWLYSAVLPLFYMLDITNSLKENRTIINKSFKSEGKAHTWGYLNDTTLYAMNWTGPNYELIAYNPVSDSYNVKKTLYRPGLNEEDNEIISGHTLYKPDMTTMVVFTQFLNQVNFIGLDDYDSFSVSLSEKPLQPEEVLLKSRTERSRYYISGSATNKYLYAIYSNQSWSNEFTENAKCEIHILDWDGNIVKVIKCDRMYKSLAIDGDDTNLYALTNDDCVDVITLK